jgi:H+/Na+-translocating ferredoxin:NAD+ oxidoreductase subunit G
MKKLKETSNTFVLGLFLCVIGAIAALILAQVAEVTKKPIEENKAKVLKDALKKVLPPFDNTLGPVTVKSADAEKYDVKFYGAEKDGKLIAVAGISKTMKGYSGEIQALVGINVDGNIRTVIITGQNETPGLGTVVCQRKTVVTIFDLFKGGGKAIALPPNPILDQFDHKTAGKDLWKVAKDGGTLKYVTGATISSRAVADVVYRISHTYNVLGKDIKTKLASGKK